MSRSGNRHQAERWLLTAKEDLRAAETLMKEGIYAQACFLAQQAGEKAVKALWYLVDADPWGHSVKRLVLEFPEGSRFENSDELADLAALLDKFYIPTRYPNGLPDLTPGQVYGRKDASEGLDAARTLIHACETWLENH